MIESLVKKAKELQAEYGVITRLDIQFNYNKGEYSARVWYKDHVIDLSLYMASIASKEVK